MTSLAPATTPRAAIYVRVSSAVQEEDGTSLDTQLERCRAYCAERGYTVAEEHVYREVHTGTELWERPKLALLRETVRHHGIDIVIAFAIDRLSRDPIHLGVIISEADHAGVDVQFVSEPLDNSPEGQLIRFVRGYAAKIEHEKFRERSQRGKRHRIEQGKPLPSPRPLYGYRWKNGPTDAKSDRKIAYEVEPETAEVVRWMFAEALRGTPLRNIAQQLSARGIPTPTGRPIWATRTIGVILAHPGYTGRAAALRNRGVRANGKWQMSRRDPSEWVALPASVMPPLVDADAWADVQERLRYNRLHAPRNNRYPEIFLLRGGFIRCGSCGRTLHAIRVPASRAPDRPTQYKCLQQLGNGPQCPAPVYISGRLIDQAAWARVERILTRPDVLAGELDRLRRNDPTEGDLATIDRDLLKLEQQRRRWVSRVDMEADDALAAEAIARLRELLGQREQLQADRARLLARQRNWARAEQQLAGLQAWCRTVAANLADLDYAGRRLALQALGVDVRVHRAGGGDGPRWSIETNIPLEVPEEEAAPLPVEPATFAGTWRIQSPSR